MIMKRQALTMLLGPSPGSTTDLSQVGVGISGLIYLGRTLIVRSESRTRSWSVRTGVGVIFYF